MNKTLFLLPLFLLLPAATQCMEQIIIITPKTMQDIRDERDKIYQKRLESPLSKTHPWDCALFQGYWSRNIELLTQPFNKGIWFPGDISSLGYSFISLVVIAVKKNKLIDECLIKEENHQKELLKKEKPEQVFFKEKKEHIQKLLTFDSKLKSTHFYDPQDKYASQDKIVYLRILEKVIHLFKPDITSKYFALLAKYKEFGPTIIKKMLLLKDMLLLLNIELPQEVHDIPLLIFEMEESLL